MKKYRKIMAALMAVTTIFVCCMTASATETANTESAPAVTETVEETAAEETAVDELTETAEESAAAAESEEADTEAGQETEKSKSKSPVGGFIMIGVGIVVFGGIFIFSKKYKGRAGDDNAVYNDQYPDENDEV